MKGRHDADTVGQILFEHFLYWDPFSASTNERTFPTTTYWFFVIQNWRKSGNLFDFICLELLENKTKNIKMLEQLSWNIVRISVASTNLFIDIFFFFGFLSFFLFVLVLPFVLIWSSFLLRAVNTEELFELVGFKIR